MTEYVAVLSKDPDSDYGVDFPDFPGCVSAGASTEEARELAAEALCLHIEGMIEDGDPIPAPTPIEKIRSDHAQTDAVDFFLVSVPDDMMSLGSRRTEEETLEDGAWDKRIEEDALAGKLDKLAEKACADHKAGSTTEI